MSQGPPPKLFREEAQIGAIECPACGAPITLKGFGSAQQVACAFCGTVCKPEDDGSLDILQRAERQRRESILPLHKRGQLPKTITGVHAEPDRESESGNVTWEIIGLSWREVVSEGVTYPWQEFLLFNPYEGYRWLIYSMSDSLWSYGGALPGAAKILPGMQPIAEYAGEHYKHFTSAVARTTYVEGEFPWQVMAGDTAQANDYVCPPKMISIEVQATDDGGSDVNFTEMTEIDADLVWRAFAMSGAPPAPQGVHPAEVNPHKTKFYMVAAAVMMIAWIVVLVGYIGGREDAVVFSGKLAPGEVMNHEVEFGTEGELSSLRFQLTGEGMGNSWAYAEVLLVDIDSEEALSVGLEVDAWSGVDQGESWSEGTNPKTVTTGGIEGGKYLLQISASADTSGDPADSLNLTITRDVPLWRYIFVPFFIIIAFPIINFVRRMAFETQRWSNSDHAETSWEP